MMRIPNHTAGTWKRHTKKKRSKPIGEDISKMYYSRDDSNQRNIIKHITQTKARDQNPIQMNTNVINDIFLIASINEILFEASLH